MQAQYGVIKAAKDVLKKRQFERKAETVKEYRAILARIEARVQSKGGKLTMEDYFAAAKRTRSASTWFKAKAAIAFRLTENIETNLVHQDDIQRQLREDGLSFDAPEWRTWEQYVGMIEKTLKALERLEAEPAPDPKTRKKRHSKRKDIGDLPKEWRETAVERMPNYRLAVLTSIVTGCRPAELVKGVNLSIEDGSLVAEIIGAKVSEKTGQPLRRLFWSLDAPPSLVRKLADSVKDGAVTARIECAKRYQGAVRAAGERAFSTKKSLSPYCFRHAAASDMKADGMSDEDIAKALGHLVTKTKKYYGQRQMGRKVGGVAPDRVEATREVKQSKPRQVSGESSKPSESGPGPGTSQ